MPGKSAGKKGSDAGFGMLSWAEKEAKREAAKKAKNTTMLSPSAFKHAFADLDPNKVP